MLRTFAGIAGVLALMAGWPGVAQAVTSPAPAGTGWKTERVAMPSGAEHAVLDSVSCPAANDCVATGDFSRQANATLPLAERWNGTAWTVQATPQPAGGSWEELMAVSCPSATRCVAVGIYNDQSQTQRMLVEQDNDGTWTVQTGLPVPAGGSGSGWLDGVWCTASDACTAVGTYDLKSANGARHPVAERWNGHTWTAQALPDPGQSGDSYLTGVWCASGSSCLTVGYHFHGQHGVTGIGKALTERWNGHTWTALTTPLPAAANNGGALDALSCQSISDCTAAGVYFTTSGHAYTLAEHWNGTAWTIQPTPSPATGKYAASQLNSVWCTAADRCTAVGLFSDSAQTGHQRPLAETWNGHSWTVQPTAHPAANQGLGSIACDSSGTCTAVGLAPQEGGATGQPVAERRA